MAKPRYSRLQPRKSSSSSTLILTLFLVFTFLVLILLALGILSIPSSSRTDLPKPNDLTSIAHSTIQAYVTSPFSLSVINILFNYLIISHFLYFFLCFSSDVDDDRGEQWVEVVSWEPRAFVYHNFLVGFELCQILPRGCKIAVN